MLKLIARPISFLLLASLIVTIWLDAWSPFPRPGIPVTGSARLIVREYPLVEQSKDNPTHQEFQHWVPASALYRLPAGALTGKYISQSASSNLNNLLALAPGDVSGFRVGGMNASKADNSIIIQTIMGHALSFNSQNGLIEMSYDHKVLPYTYDQIIHGNQDTLAIFNPASDGQQVWFYALRDGLWYFVEVDVSQ